MELERQTQSSDLHIASHPTRLRILELIQERQKSYATKLEQLMDINRKIISFHLSILEKHGLLESSFDIKNDREVRPVAVRYYKLTLKGTQVLESIRLALGQK